MKALSLTQPWASLVAIGAKRIETRSWPTGFHGTIAVHAAKGWSAEDRRLAASGMMRPHLERAGAIFTSAPPEHWYHAPGYRYVSGLPLGAIVAVADVVDVFPTDAVGWSLLQAYWPDINPDEEQAFGDFSAGRYGWLLYAVRRLPEPIPCRGALGLWTVPEDIAGRICGEAPAGEGDAK